MASGSWQQSQEHGPNKVQVTILASEWGSSKGGVSTINRELAIQLAKFPEVQITYFLPKCSEVDRKVALSHGIKILEATRIPGCEELEWLNFPPEHLRIDAIVGHGVKLGHQAQVIRNSHKCKWVQVIHTDPEELGMFKSYENPISTGEEKHKVEVELCEMANFVVAVGPKLAEAFRKYLRFCQKHRDVFDLTPGIFEEFVSVQHVPEDGKYCSVLVFGRGDAEDFTLKGFDTAAKAVTTLPETSLMFVGAPDGKHEDIAKRLLEFGLPENRLRVRGYVKTREDLKRLFHEVDLVLMPSRTEGFGLTGLEALSAGLPVIVSKNSGFGEALSNVPFGSSFVIDSEDTNAWTAAIKDIWNKKRHTRLDEAKGLRRNYGTKYNWSKQCKYLLEKMVNSVNDASSDVEMPSQALGRLHVKSSEDEKDSSFTNPDPSQKKAKEEEKEVKQHADVILKVVLKLACGSVWVAGTALILTKYRNDPERMIQLFQKIALPAGVVLKYLFEGSITCILQVIDLHGLQTLWQNFESGLLKKHLENVLITEDLYKLAKRDEIILEVFLEETITAHLSVTSGLMARDASSDVEMPSEALGRLHIKSNEDEKDSSFTHPDPSQKKAREEGKKGKQHAGGKKRKLCLSVPEDCYDMPPKLRVKPPKRSDLPVASKPWGNDDLPIDILLLTVEDCEFLSCFSFLDRPFKSYKEEVGPIYFGYTRSNDDQEKLKVALMKCSKGAAVPGGSLTVVKNAVRVLSPKAVFSVGTCSGLSSDKVKLGDVVVSAKLTTAAEFKSPVSRHVNDLVRDAPYGWVAPLENPDELEVEVHCDGDILSQTQAARCGCADLHLQYPEAIAVETEGEGVFAAAYDENIEWVVVKGVAHFVNQTQLSRSEWMSFASTMAASVVAKMLNDPIFFQEWPHCNQDVSVKEQTQILFTSESFPSSSVASHRTEASSSCQSYIIEWIRQIYQKREGVVFPVPWCEGFSFQLENIFTRLRIFAKEKTRGTLTKEITNMTSIFTSHQDCQHPRIVLIEGEPGMGKTTYCQKLAYDWATKQDREWDESFPRVKVLLLLRCRETESSIWEAIGDQILPEEIGPELKETFFRFVRENPSKVLLVLDGLDEADPQKLAVYLSLIQRKQLPGCHIVLTSRPEAGNKVRPYSDTLLEIVGFTSSDAKCFIRKYFRHAGQMAEKLIEDLYLYYVFKGPLQELTKNPLNILMLCVLFEDFGGVLPNSKTQLYLEIVLFVLRRYEIKNHLPSSGKDLLSVYKKELMTLGRMAQESLCKRELHFEDVEGNFKESMFIKFGFLSIQAGGRKRTPCFRYSFFHKSFQEFFSGLYVAFSILDGAIDKKSVLTEERCFHQLKQVFMFMSGIIASQSEETAVSIVNDIASLANVTDSRSPANRNSYLTLAFDVMTECKTCSQNLYTKLVYAFGKSLHLTKIVLNLASGIQIAAFSQVLAVNTSLTTLHLPHSFIGAEGATSLSQALAVNTSLTTLHLPHSFIGAEGATSLSKALAVNTSLTTLKLSSTFIGAEGATSLSQAVAVNTSLTTLNLSHNSIGAEGATSLSQALAVNTSLTTLNLSHNSIGDEGATSLSQALALNTSLTTLDLSHNSIGAEGATSLSQALALNISLTTLHLSGNFIGAEGATSLSQALALNTSLTTLDLTWNSIGAEGATSLSQALALNTSLTTLDLFDNSIGDEGATSLSKALAVNTSLTTLHLSRNSIGAEGATSLSQALAVNTSLTTLHLFDNSIGAEGATSLSQALAVNTSLTTLNLSHNSIGAEGATSFSQTLAVNTSLTTLNLSGNSIGDEGATSLSQALALNTSLTTLELFDNSIGAEGATPLSQALAVYTSLIPFYLRDDSIGDPPPSLDPRIKLI